MSSSSRPSTARLLLELPLALNSWLLHKVARAVVGVAAPRLQPGSASAWKIYSEELFARPGVFPILLVNAPRWNPHALLSMAGPLRVEREISFELEPVRRSAAAWSAVVYAYPGARTVAHVGSATGPLEGDHYTFRLPPGRYALSLRYYDWSESPTLPAVSVDGRTAMEGTHVDPTTNTFYRDLVKRRGLLSRGLHFHVYPMLRLAPWLPTGWVERQYLPVGNPETTFRSGVVEPGERLALRLSERLLATHYAFICTYSRDSLPLEWQRLETPDVRLPPARERGYYVVRLHRTREEHPPLEAEDFTIWSE